MRPARGCSCDGSGREGPVRKEETSCAVDGSKGVGRKVSAGSWRSDDEEDEEDGDEDEDEEEEDFRPVRESQIDILVSRCWRSNPPGSYCAQANYFWIT